LFPEDVGYRFGAFIAMWSDNANDPDAFVFACRCCHTFKSFKALRAHWPKCLLESTRTIHQLEPRVDSAETLQAVEEDAVDAAIEEPEDVEEEEEEEEGEEEEEEEEEEDAELLSALSQTVKIVVPKFLKRAQRPGFCKMVNEVLNRISIDTQSRGQQSVERYEIWIFFIVVSKTWLIYGILWTFSFFRQVTYPRTKHATNTQ